MVGEEFPTHEENENLKRKRPSSPVRLSRCKVTTTASRSAQPVGLFTSFDKSNSLLTFPDSFVSCVNCGDLISLFKLMKSRINKQCEIKILKKVVDLVTFMKMFELMDDLYPDQVFHVESTKVVRNQLRAKLQFEFTENKMLRSVIAKSTTNPHLLSLCPNVWKLVKEKGEIVEIPHSTEQEAAAVAGGTSEEMFVQGNAWMLITFDPLTKHVTHFELKYSFVPERK